MVIVKLSFSLTKHHHLEKQYIIIWRSNTIILIVIGEEPISVLSGCKTEWIPVCISVAFLLIQWG